MLKFWVYLYCGCWIPREIEGGIIYFMPVFDFCCLKSRSFLSVEELLDVQRGYVVAFWQELHV